MWNIITITTLGLATWGSIIYTIAARVDFVNTFTVLSTLAK